MTDLARLGDNSGDIDLATQIGDNLREKHPDLVKRAGELAGMEERAPLPLANPDDADKVSTAIRQCSEFLKSTEAIRVEDKEPYLSGGRAVDGFFQRLVRGVNDTRAKLLRGRTIWDEKIEAEARRARGGSAAPAGGSRGGRRQGSHRRRQGCRCSSRDTRRGSLSGDQGHGGRTHAHAHRHRSRHQFAQGMDV